MTEHSREIRRLLARVRRRWRALAACRAVLRAALGVSAIGVVALVVARWVAETPSAQAAVGAAACVLAIVLIVRTIAPLRYVPSDARVARFIEERVPSLDDRLASAVEVVATDRETGSPTLVGPMLADAVSRARAVDLDAVVPRETLRRVGFQAAAASLLLVAIAVAGIGTVRQAFDAATLTLFPGRVTLQVAPGNARIKAGTPLTIEASLSGNRAPVVPQVQIAAGGTWRAAPMAAASTGRFRVTFDAVRQSFTYRIVAGAVVSPTYDITVAHAPQVTRIDVQYTYPAALGLKPRTEEDAGDIYAPAGTDVRVRVHTDRPAAIGQMALANGDALALAAEAPTLFMGTLKVVEDGSYRIALTDRDGVSNTGSPEYFIRVLEDRPPDVRVLKPASDRAVTRLEEVDLEAQADDDYGIDRLELVYAIGGLEEKAVPFDVPRHATSVTGRRTLYLEDLDVQPGDFVSYYVRARDLTRGKRPSEARSDIFFLDVKPFEQEFSLAQSQAQAGGGRPLDDLVAAQKEVVVATWKLDRRAQSAKGARSEQDIRAVSRAEAELKSKAEQMAGTFRESMRRDPRLRQPGRGRGASRPQAPAGTPAREEDAMGAAAAAMGQAVTSLDALKTGAALPPEMEALTQLLKAQANVTQRQIARQQAGSGSGDNNRNYDLSTLFDKELQRMQQTNYETPISSEQREDPNAGALEKIKDLAARQDELMKRQQELARERARMSEEELTRQLEKLTREQIELRQRAEELARLMDGQPSSRSGQPSGQKPGQQGGQQASQQAGQQSGQQGQSGQRGGSGEGGSGMQGVTDDMRNAASDLRRQDPAQASARANRALEKLRDLERQLERARPDERRRALGDMQLETRQLAEAERQVASEAGKVGRNQAGQNALRRLAGEQERIAERVKRLQQALQQHASDSSSAGKDQAEKNAQAAGEAARDIEQQRLAERVQKSADEMRAAAGDSPGGQGSASSEGGRQTATDGPVPEAKNSEAGRAARARAAAQQDIARTLDRLADGLASAGARNEESRRLVDQLARTQALRERMDGLSHEIERLGRENAQTGGTPTGSGRAGPSSQKAPGESGQTVGGQPGGNSGARDILPLLDEYGRQLQQARDLVDQQRREDPSFGQGDPGFTLEGPGITLSAPGTEAFKQDFARWQELRRQATLALEVAESSLLKRLQENESRDRLAAGADDKAPPQYQEQVDRYFKALAGKKKP